MAQPLSKSNVVVVLLVLVGIGVFSYVRYHNKHGTTQPTHPSIADDDKSIDESLRKDDVKDLVVEDVLTIPYIFWGGDVATFVANGGETTQPGSIFDKLGLKLKLVREDDIDKQVKPYKEGKSPFLRGTMSMLGQAAEDICGDGRTCPVVFLQLTWSAGDHLVARQGLKTIEDLKGKKIALQKGGPHVGMLNDILQTAQFKWSDVTPVWTDDVTGDNGPAEKFRKDASIDACFVVTTDATGLAGGLEKAGTGTGQSVAGAHVLVSTKQMLRSIADVYACRKDFYDKHKDVVEKFVTGYLKGTEQLLALKKDHKPGSPSAKYKEVLKVTRERFGKDISSDDDADGLISDAVFVGLPGNYAFFKDEGNLSGFKAKRKAALDLADSLGASKRRGFPGADLDYAKVKKAGDLTAVVIPELVARFADNPKEKNTLYSFTVYFGGNQDTFPVEQYGKDFQRAAEVASLFGNAIIKLRGHANPGALTMGLAEHGVNRRVLTARQGRYYLKDNTEVVELGQLLDALGRDNLRTLTVRSGGGRGMQSAKSELDQLLDLSNRRAAAVRKAVLDYATSRGHRLDTSQMKSVGVGGTEPVYLFPKNDDVEGQRNRRVEFRIVQVAVEDIRTGEAFDY